MGLLNDIFHLYSYDKLKDKYGYGVAQSYIDLISERDFKKQISQIIFNMNDYLRKNSNKYSAQDIEYLRGIIEQMSYAYDTNSANSLITEWKQFCSSVEFKDNIEYIFKQVEELVFSELSKDTEIKYTKENETKLHEIFGNIYSAENSKEVKKYYEELKSYLWDNFEYVLGKKMDKSISDEVTRLGKAWDK